jgi:hypothetical protein
VTSGEYKFKPVNTWCPFFYNGYVMKFSPKKMHPTKRGSYMKILTTYQISPNKNCSEKCDAKRDYMCTVYKSKQPTTKPMKMIEI